MTGFARRDFKFRRIQVTLRDMLDRNGHLLQFCSMSALALALLTIAPEIAWPQAASPPSPAKQPQPAPQQTEPPPTAPAENPGLINELEKMFEKSKSLLPSIKSPSETVDDLNARAKDAGESLTNMAKPSTMVKGRAACVVAANGAPDCKAGADKLCQSKGYKEGKSLDTDAAEKCSPKVFIPGRQREPGDCKTENYVIRALCQ